jgi:hypothetical protein
MSMKEDKTIYRRTVVDGSSYARKPVSNVEKLDTRTKGGSIEGDLHLSRGQSSAHDP